MWPFNKKKLPKSEEKHVPVKGLVTMKVVMVNNRTDKEYIISSNNDYGLIMRVNDIGVRIRQRTSLPTDFKEADGKGDEWVLIASLSDFSVLSAEWKEIEI